MTPEEACDGKRWAMQRVTDSDKRSICSSRSGRGRERPKRTEAKAMAEPKRALLMLPATA